MTSGTDSGRDLVSTAFAVVPAFNAGEAVLEVAEGVAGQLARNRVLIVDDGSTDDAPRRLEEKGYRVLVHPHNMGKGAALQTGFRAALSEGASGVITLDADGQHDPAWIPRFLAAAGGGADIVVGSRMKDPGPMPWLRVAVNRFTSFVVSRMAGTVITDSQSGYRWIAAGVLRAVPLESRRFDAESEILIKAACLGFRIREIPMPALYGEETSRIHPFRDTLRFFRLVGRSLRWRREMSALREGGDTA
jgi:glycosyltransferase involved in cell wall biosynthesis